MLTSTIVKMAFRNIQANWKHSLAAILSLASGFVALVLFESYFVKVKELYRNTYGSRTMYGDLLIEKKGAQEAGLDGQVKFSLNEEEQGKIFALLGEYAEVGNTVRFLNVVGTSQSGSNTAIFMGYGYDVKNGARMRGEAWAWNANAGQPLDVDGGEKIVIGKSIARSLGCKYDNAETSFTAIGYYPPTARAFECGSKISLSTTTDQGQMNALVMDVAGITDAGFSEIDARFLAMPLETAQKLLDTKRVSMISVKLRNENALPAFLASFRQKAQAQGLELSVQDWRDHPYGDLFVRTLDYLRIFRGFVMIVIIFIVAMSVLNTFMKLVVERTREIGTLRSLGFVPQFIVKLFAIEGVVLACVGAGVGIVCSVAGTVLINWIKIPYKAGILSEPVPFVVAFAPSLYLWVGLFLGAIAAVTATISSWRRARLHLPDALASN